MPRSETFGRTPTVPWDGSVAWISGGSIAVWAGIRFSIGYGGPNGQVGIYASINRET